MFVESMSLLTSMAIEVVALIYPKEFKDPHYKREIFDVIELVADDLTKRNVSLFVDPYINKLACIKDICIGDKCVFTAANKTNI